MASNKKIKSMLITTKLNILLLHQEPHHYLPLLKEFPYTLTLTVPHQL